MLISILLLLSATRASAVEPVLPANALPVPIVAQANSWSCGAAALQGVLYYWGVFDDTETSLYKKLQTTKKDGTEPAKIAEVASSYGLRAELRRGLEIADLKAALADGDTPVIDLQAWPDKPLQKSWSETWSEGHYIVLVGLDSENAYFMDPSAHGAYAYIPIPEFVDRWHDYEDRHGFREDNVHLAILIHGASGKPAFPANLIRIN